MKTSIEQYKCVYWNETMRKWDDFGCKLHNNKCLCNHTTNFAMLLSLYSINSTNLPYTNCVWCQTLLTLLSVIGSFLSFICLIFCICIYIRSKKIRYGITQTIFTLNLFYLMNLLGFNLIYLIWSIINIVKSTDELCMAIGLILHFFLLSVFFNILMVLVLRLITKAYIFKNIYYFSIISLIISYGLSGLLIIVNVSVGPSGFKKYITEDKL